MDLVAVENDLVARLITDITPPIEIRSYPDDFNTYIGQLTNDGGAILVVYQGSVYEEPEANRSKKLVQNRTANWQFTIIQKDLSIDKQHHGVYTILEEIRVSLSGYTITGLDDISVLAPVGDGFLFESHNFWVYQTTFSHTIEEAES